MDGKLSIYGSTAFQGLREARRHIYIAVSVFTAGFIIGLLTPERFGGLLESFQDLAERFRDKNAPSLILMIFLQNSSTALISILLGPLLGIVPVISAVSNGLLIGVVISMGVQLNITAMLWKLIPHGIFELPAIFISWGTGIWLGTWPFRSDRAERFRARAGKAFYIFVIIVLPLLVTAAVIEGLSIAAMTGGL